MGFTESLMIDFLKISYDRIIGTETITLNDSNYKQYGYLKDSKGYYLYDEETEENVYFTEHDVDIKQTYTHILPPPSKFTPTYADVDKQGSGRNENDGLMIRERVGHYQSLDVSWNIIPHSKEGINLVRILKNLPELFTIEYHDIENEFNETSVHEFYRGDISYDLYLFIKDRQIWKGISTTFIQYDVTPYDDSKEPELLALTIRKLNIDTNEYETLEIDRKDLRTYLEDGWELMD